MVPTRKPTENCIFGHDIALSSLNSVGDFSLYQLAKEVNHVHQTRVCQVLNVLQLSSSH
jgi:hypothetical protein